MSTIREGDIVLLPKRYHHVFRKAIIVLRSDADDETKPKELQMQIIWKGKGWIWMFLERDIKVIGNIYENPELARL